MEWIICLHISTTKKKRQTGFNVRNRAQWRQYWQHKGFNFTLLTAIKLWGGILSPVTVESRHSLLPKLYSPLPTPNSWKDRENWPATAAKPHLWSFIYQSTVKQWSYRDKCRCWVTPTSKPFLPVHKFDPPFLFLPEEFGNWYSRCRGNLKRNRHQQWVLEPQTYDCI